MKEPKPMREVHEIQEQIHEEEKKLSRKERLAKIRREANALIQKHNLKFEQNDKAA